MGKFVYIIQGVCVLICDFQSHFRSSFTLTGAAGAIPRENNDNTTFSEPGVMQAVSLEFEH